MLRSGPNENDRSVRGRGRRRDDVSDRFHPTRDGDLSEGERPSSGRCACLSAKLVRIISIVAYVFLLLRQETGRGRGPPGLPSTRRHGRVADDENVNEEVLWSLDLSVPNDPSSIKQSSPEARSFRRTPRIYLPELVFPSIAVDIPDQERAELIQLRQQAFARAKSVAEQVKSGEIEVVVVLAVRSPTKLEDMRNSAEWKELVEDGYRLAPVVMRGEAAETARGDAAGGQRRGDAADAAREIVRGLPRGGRGEHRSVHANSSTPSLEWKEEGVLELASVNEESSLWLAWIVAEYDNLLAKANGKVVSEGGKEAPAEKDQVQAAELPTISSFSKEDRFIVFAHDHLDGSWHECLPFLHDLPEFALVEKNRCRRYPLRPTLPFYLALAMLRDDARRKNRKGEKGTSSHTYLNLAFALGWGRYDRAEWRVTDWMWARYKRDPRFFRAPGLLNWTKPSLLGIGGATSHDDWWTSTHLDRFFDRSDFEAQLLEGCCGQMVVSPAAILSKPKSLWEAQLEWLLTYTNAKGSRERGEAWSPFYMGRVLEFSWEFLMRNGARRVVSPEVESAEERQRVVSGVGHTTNEREERKVVGAGGEREPDHQREHDPEEAIDPPRREDAFPQPITGLWGPTTPAPNHDPPKSFAGQLCLFLKGETFRSGQQHDRKALPKNDFVKAEQKLASESQVQYLVEPLLALGFDVELLLFTNACDGGGAGVYDGGDVTRGGGAGVYEDGVPRTTTTGTAGAGDEGGPPPPDRRASWKPSKSTRRSSPSSSSKLPPCAEELLNFYRSPSGTPYHFRRAVFEDVSSYDMPAVQDRLPPHLGAVLCDPVHQNQCHKSRDVMTVLSEHFLKKENGKKSAGVVTCDAGVLYTRPDLIFSKNMSRLILSARNSTSSGETEAVDASAKDADVEVSPQRWSFVDKRYKPLDLSKVLWLSPTWREWEIAGSATGQKEGRWRVVDTWTFVPGWVLDLHLGKERNSKKSVLGKTLNKWRGDNKNPKNLYGDKKWREVISPGFLTGVLPAHDGLTLFGRSQHKEFFSKHAAFASLATQHDSDSSKDWNPWYRIAARRTVAVYDPAVHLGTAEQERRQADFVRGW